MSQVLSNSEDEFREKSDEFNVVFKDYLTVRVTLDHDQYDQLEQITKRYTDNYIIFAHVGDSTVPNPHFHIIIPTTDLKLLDRFVYQLKSKFNKKGNGFYSAKYLHNGVLSAIGYGKHGLLPDYPPRFAGADYEAMLRLAVTYVKPVNSYSPKGAPVPKVYKERMGEHVLTLGNLLKQAHKHANGENRLKRIIDRMVDSEGFIPSRDLVTNGVPEEFYEIWERRVNKNYVTMHWSSPHARSEDKQKWSDKVTLSRFNN